MYYVLSFYPTTQYLAAFHVTDDHEHAMQTRFAWERENREEVVSGEEEVVMIGAPDLHILTRRYSRYFVRYEDGLGIDRCYFCRSFLGWREPIADLKTVEALSSAAWHNGHCLLCHGPYPVWCREGHFHLRRGFAEHIFRCPVLQS